MRWLVLKTTGAIAAALIGIILILFQQNSLKSSFQATQRVSDSLKTLDADYITLQRIVLQASYFPYFDNDAVLSQIKKIRQRLKNLTENRLLRRKDYTKTREELLHAKKEFEAVTKRIHEFLTLNASLKNSSVYLPTLTLKAYDIFDMHNESDRDTVVLLSKISAAIFLTKNALDDSFLEEIKEYKKELERLKRGVEEKDRKRLLQASIGHLTLFLKIFPKFHDDLEAITKESFQKEIESAIESFFKESKREISHINSLGELFLALYLISITMVLYFIFRSEKENIKLKRVSEKLKKSLITDHLTGLENREAYLSMKQRMNHPALILINIDRFKHINEFYGSKMGDMVLRQSAVILKEIVPPYLNAHIYRLGGDDFGILYEFKSKERTEKVIKEIIEEFHKRAMSIDGVAIDISISIGASYAKKLFETADMALKVTKSSTRRRYTIYDPSIDVSEKISKNIRALKELKRAIQDKDIVPYFQPIVELERCTVAKYEALARMRTRKGEILEPKEFLDVAKEAKLSGEITAAILHQTLKIASRCDTIFSVNISAGDIMSSYDRKNIFELLKSYRKSASRIVFEIVESEEIEDYDLLGEFIEEVRGFGCKIAIDDFGSGYSNFEKLLQLSVDILKIDGTLIKDIESSEHAQLVVRTIVDFAKTANLETVAEYVHSEGVLLKVKELGIDFGQGYHFGKPSPAEKIERGLNGSG